MELQRRRHAVQHHLPEIADEAVHRVKQEHPLNQGRVAVHVVKNSGEVHQKADNDIPEILDIPEQHQQHGQEEPQADIEHHHAQNGVQEKKEPGGDGHAVQQAENQEHAHSQGEIAEKLCVLRKEKNVPGHIDAAVNLHVAPQGEHALGGTVREEGKGQSPAEKKGGVVINAMAKKLRKDQAHDRQCQQWGQNAPDHAQNGAPVLVFKVPLHQLLKEEAIFLPICSHSSLQF